MTAATDSQTVTTAQVEVIYLLATGNTYHMTDPRPVDTVDPAAQAQAAMDEDEDIFAFFYRSNTEITSTDGDIWQFQYEGVFRTGKFFIAPRVNYFSRHQMIRTPAPERTRLLAVSAIEGSPDLVQYPSGRFLGFHPASDTMLLMAA